MPKMSGLEMCERIRKIDDKTPIIITTAHTNTEYLLKAVELQLVKYLIKPIDEDQLTEALELCFEKFQEGGSNIVQLTPEFTFDTFNLVLFHHDEVVRISQQERDCFKLLLQNTNRICSYTEIENVVNDGEGMSSDAMRSLIKNMRKKTDKNLIENHTKIGYKITPLC